MSVSVRVSNTVMIMLGRSEGPTSFYAFSCRPFRSVFLFVGRQHTTAHIILECLIFTTSFMCSQHRFRGKSAMKRGEAHTGQVALEG